MQCAAVEAAAERGIELHVSKRPRSRRIRSRLHLVSRKGLALDRTDAASQGIKLANLWTW